MRFQLCTVALVIMGLSAAGAQVASHGPTAAKAVTSSPAPTQALAQPAPAKPVARVNGAVLTDRDLVREMYSMFPYARQHNGFPKDMEPQIRQGALQMIVFEELLYQEAKRRNLVIAPARIARAEAQFRKQFPSKLVYQGYLNVELNGSKKALREQIRRSLLIEDMLMSEVTSKSRVTVAQAKEFYDKNPKNFFREEKFKIQSISIIPPNTTPDVLSEARRRAEDAAKQAKAAKSYREFGLLAEKLSDDDYKVNMGARKPARRDELPKEIVKLASAMKVGDVSDLIQLGNAFTVFRLEAHTLPGKVPFAEVKSQLLTDLQKEKVEKVRSALGKKLRANATIEMM